MLFRRHEAASNVLLNQQVTQHNESYEEHKGTAEHPNRRQVGNSSVLQNSHLNSLKFTLICDMVDMDVYVTESAEIFVEGVFICVFDTRYFSASVHVFVL